MTDVRDFKYVNDEKTYKYIKDHSKDGGIVDNHLDGSSTNPVQNKVITSELADLRDMIGTAIEYVNR
jgi:hypothetical protein